jgi:hypothetical protein
MSQETLTNKILKYVSDRKRLFNKDLLCIDIDLYINLYDFCEMLINSGYTTSNLLLCNILIALKYLYDCIFNNAFKSKNHMCSYLKNINKHIDTAILAPNMKQNIKVIISNYFIKL